MSSSSLSTLNSQLSTAPGPIGIFDSGYGGLTILHGIRQLLPEYDYLYLGDNARTPYGPRSFEVVYEFTRQAVMKLFEMGCHLIILGCNTASAKALRTIQQNDIPQIDPERRVLGVIRPTAEVIGELTQSRHVGVLATEGTIKSESYNRQEAHRPDHASRPSDRHHHPRLHPLSAAHAQDSEIPASWRPRHSAGRVCGREPSAVP